MVLEESKEMVRLYIINNSGCTIGDVVRHMNNLQDIRYRLSKITTGKVIHEFEARNIITIQKPERKGQSCHLLINESNAFNLIAKWIHETEIAAKLVQKNLSVIFRLFGEYSVDSKPKELEELLRHFNIAKDVVKMMIDVILLDIDRQISSKEDKLTLTLKAINVIAMTLKYTLLPRPPLTLSEYFGFSEKEVSKSAKKFGEKVGILPEHFTSLADKFDYFDKQFLSTNIRLKT